MLNTIFGSKQKMSHLYVEGTRVPVTYVQAGPCIVTQIKKKDVDGYWAVQLGFGEKRIATVTKPIRGHIKAAYKDKKAARFLREVMVKSEPKFKVGDIVHLTDVIKKGDQVAVSGVSKGKGFAGVVKRWHFAGGPRTHGQSDRLRAPGSIGQGTTPGRVRKGKKMAGRMGSNTTTVKNLVVVEVDKESGQIAISGAIPGRPGALIRIKKLASGKLDELVQEAPEVQIQEGEESVESVENKEQKEE
jgi:large subunit ribosomal protein L3